MFDIIYLEFDNICSLYRSPKILKARLRWTGHVAKMEEGRSAFKILIGKPT